jgi:hypothetical protein
MRSSGFDYNSAGKLDHLVFYRPGSGKISIFRNSRGVLDSVWRSDVGLENFDLKDKNDRGLAFDLESTGKMDQAGLVRCLEQVGGWRLQEAVDAPLQECGSRPTNRACSHFGLRLCWHWSHGSSRVVSRWRPRYLDSEGFDSPWNDDLRAGAPCAKGHRRL